MRAARLELSDAIITPIILMRMGVRLGPKEGRFVVSKDFSRGNSHYIRKKGKAEERTGNPSFPNSIPVAQPTNKQPSP